MQKEYEDNRQDEKIWKDKCLESLFHKYYFLVLNIAGGYLDYAESLTICEEVFYILYRHYDMTLSDEKIKVLLIRIAVEKSIEFMENRKLLN